MDLFDRNGVWPAARKAVIEYKAGVYPRDVLRIETLVAHRGTTSVTLRHVVRRVSDGVVAAEAEIVFVCVDRVGRATPFPEEIARFLGPRTSASHQPIRVPAGDAELAVDVRGTGGTPVLFVHGFPFDRTMWRHQLAALTRCKRIAPDLRGVGASTAPAGADGYSLGRYADDLVAVLDTLGVGSIAVCGLSLGGYVVFELLRRHAERVRAVILVDTRADPDTPEGQRGRDELASVVTRDGPDAMLERRGTGAGCRPPFAARSAGGSRPARRRASVGHAPRTWGCPRPCPRPQTGPEWRSIPAGIRRLRVCRRAQVAGHAPAPPRDGRLPGAIVVRRGRRNGGVGHGRAGRPESGRAAAAGAGVFGGGADPAVPRIVRRAAPLLRAARGDRRADRTGAGAKPCLRARRDARAGRPPRRPGNRPPAGTDALPRRRDPRRRGEGRAVLGALSLRLAGRRGALKHVPVLRDVGLPLRRRVFLGKDSGDRALGLARAAVDALVGVDVELVLALVDAVHRAHVDAGAVFDVDAGFGDDVRHSRSPKQKSRAPVDARAPNCKHRLGLNPVKACDAQPHRSSTRRDGGARARLRTDRELAHRRARAPVVVGGGHGMARCRRRDRPPRRRRRAGCTRSSRSVGRRRSPSASRSACPG